jgi:hypothetical protein
LVLGSLTAGIYILYWAYKTWSLLKKQANNQSEPLDKTSPLSLFKNISPAWRTAALLSPLIIGLIPFVADFLKLLIADAIVIYVAATLVIGITALHPGSNSFPRRQPLLATGLVVGSGLILAGLARGPGPFLLVSLMSGAAPCAIVQHWLNQYWKSVEDKDALVRQGFNAWELVAIIVGACFVGMIAAGMIIGVKP